MRTSRFHLLALASAATLLAGCAAPPQSLTVNLSSRFDVNEALAALEPGNSQIRGSALLRQQGGGIVTCAGLHVGLIPVTAHATERIQAIYGSPQGGYRPIQSVRIQFQPDEALYRSAQKAVRCDAQGFFRFDNLREGEYYVLTAITWGAASQYGQVPQGGALSQRVYLRAGESKDIVLTMP